MGRNGAAATPIKSFSQIADRVRQSFRLQMWLVFQERWRKELGHESLAQAEDQKAGDD
jgi:hypothetical protein